MFFESPWQSSKWLAIANESVSNYTSSHFPFQAKVQPCVLPKVVPTVKIFLHQCLSRLFQRVVIVYKFYLLESVCIKCRLINKHCSGFLFLTQTIREYTPLNYKCIHGSKRYYNSRNLYIWATNSCKLLKPSESSQVRSCIYLYF